MQNMGVREGRKCTSWVATIKPKLSLFLIISLKYLHEVRLFSRKDKAIILALLLNDGP
jgi:hypothetical protein